MACHYTGLADFATQLGQKAIRVNEADRLYDINGVIKQHERRVWLLSTTLMLCTVCRLIYCTREPRMNGAWCLPVSHDNTAPGALVRGSVFWRLRRRKATVTVFLLQKCGICSTVCRDYFFQAAKYGDERVCLSACVSQKPHFKFHRTVSVHP